MDKSGISDRRSKNINALHGDSVLRRTIELVVIMSFLAALLWWAAHGK